MLSPLKRLLIQTGWAPLAVLIVHAAVAKTSLRQPLDFPIHFSGGASMAFVFFYALEYLAPLFGAMSLFARYLFSLTFACTVGVFWEFGELFSDAFWHTHIQQSLHETMSDLIADTSGAIFALGVVLIARCLRRH